MEPRKQKYWKVYLSKAWDGTKDELRKHSLIETVIAISVLIVGINIDIFIVGSKLNQIIIHLLQGIGYLAVAFGLLFLIKSLGAHKRIYEENQETISSFRGANESSEKQQEQLKIYFGIYWDKELNPYCPACKTPLTLISDSRPMCYKCDKIIGITDSEKRMGLAEARKIISSSYQTIESLEGQQLPKLEVNFKQGGNRYAKEQSGKLNGKNYIFSIELMNLGSGNIINPKVRLFIRSSEDDNFDEQWNLQVNSKDIPKTDEEGEGEFVGVLQYFVHTEHKNGIDALWMIGNEKDNNNKKARITVQKYDIKIIVSSDNGGDPIPKHFRFIPKPKNPKLCMEMID